VIAPLTATGRALAESYTCVLAHEHLLTDTTAWLDEGHAPTRHLRDAPVGEATVAEVRRNPFACRDNLLLDDPDVAVDELGRLRAAGRVLVVDVTPENTGRSPAAIAEVSRRAGVDVVFGCGLYVAESRPQDRSSEAHRDHILAQFAEPAPRPSVIGEIGTGDPIKPVEERSLRGAAMAQAELGVPLYVHLHPWARRGHEALDIVEAAGGDVARTILCHLDPQIRGGLGYHRDLLERGATIAFDVWGDEYPYGDVAMPTDSERIDATVRLIEDGYGGRLVHSHDVCTKTQLRRFGGAGYDHLPLDVAPRLEAAGLSRTEVRRQLAGNVLRLLAA
jgi:phosphotriesterase-related protein